MMRVLRFFTPLIAAVLCIVLHNGSEAQANSSRRHGFNRIDVRSVTYDSHLNDNVVTILSGNRDGASLGIVYDLSEVLDDGERLRVMPVVGRGSAQNVHDVLGLRGIDMGISHSNLLNHFAKSGELGDVKGRIAYVAKLFNEEMHIVAAPSIRDINDLAGKTVNLGEVGSGTQLTSQLVFKALGIDVKEVNLEQADALAAVREGRIAASILITARPSKVLAELKSAQGMKLVPIPYTKPLYDDYYPATLEHADYPDLIPEGQHVDTIANCAVIIAFNWPKNSDRYRRVAKFVDAFFDRFDDFRKSSRGSKWSEVNFAATLEGWNRFPEAQDWIDRSKSIQAEESQFKSFVQKSGTQIAQQTDAQRQELFRQYLQWKKSRGQD